MERFYPLAFKRRFEAFDIQQIRHEFQGLYEQAIENYQQLQGEHNQLKGIYAEHLILRQFRVHAAKKNTLFCSITHNLPQDFQFIPYSTVRFFIVGLEYAREMQVDIYARAQDEEEYSVIGEVKNRGKKKFSIKEAQEFLPKLEAVKEQEQLKKAIGFIFSSNGFYKNAESYLNKKGIAYSSDEKWLGKKASPKKEKVSF